MKLNREMRRKAQKNWSYDQYAKSRSIRAAKERMQRCMALASADWKREVSLVVPKWLQVASLYVPPKWYITSINWLGQWFPPDAFVKRVVAKKKIPRSIRWAMIFPTMIPAVILDWVNIKPFIFLRRLIRTFGITTAFRPMSKDKMRMTIRYWFGKIYERIYDV
jgi:hypothetical protein